jgi:nicotinamidase-related amidase
VPITTIDPATALLVIDLQVGLVDAPTIHPVRDVATRAGKLAEAFRKEGLPVVFVYVEGAGDRLPSRAAFTSQAGYPAVICSRCRP